MKINNNLVEVQPGLYANKYCRLCDGRGTVYEPDGYDDVTAEECECLETIPPEVINLLTEEK